MVQRMSMQQGNARRLRSTCGWGRCHAVQGNHAKHVAHVVLAERRRRLPAPRKLVQVVTWQHHRPMSAGHVVMVF